MPPRDLDERRPALGQVDADLPEPEHGALTGQPTAAELNAVAAERDGHTQGGDSAAAAAEARDQEIEGLRAALATRLVIGQAEGLLMARYNLDTDDAFRLLTKLSQEGHVKLREVAARLVADAEAKARGS